MFKPVSFVVDLFLEQLQVVNVVSVSRLLCLVSDLYEKMRSTCAYQDDAEIKVFYIRATRLQSRGENNVLEVVCYRKGSNKHLYPFNLYRLSKHARASACG